MAESGPRIAIVFSCDLGYLFPSLAVGKQAVEQAPPGTDVRLILDADALPQATIDRIFEVTGVQVTLADPTVRAQIAAVKPHSSVVAGSYLSRSALLRLFLPDFLGDAYDRILYLDGDMQVLRPLAPLFAIPAPAGHFLVVKDWVALHAAADMPGHERQQAYLTKLGLPRETWGGYFNSGMMLGDLTAWRSVTKPALEFYQRYPERCLYFDQCALNATAYDRITHVPARWNFLRSHMVLPAYRSIDPAIIHFASRPKPWDGGIAPWGPAMFRPYVELAAQLQGLDLPWRRQPWYRMIGYDLRERLQMLTADRAYQDRLGALLAAG
jgi:lipopolysaccharide biosynthesis glycosyltransferase